MKTTKSGVLSSVVALVTGLVIMMSCTSTSPVPSGTVALKMEATSTTGGTITGRKFTTTTITDFRISLREIKFDFDKEDSHYKTDSTYNEDTKLMGPFVVDVMEPSGFVEQLITTVNLPNAQYEEIEFILHKSTEAGDMNGKSIYIAGTIDGKPFVFWHDTTESFEVDFENTATDLVISGNSAAPVITFNLEQLFSTVKGGVNLSLAVDGDLDGVIEINPGSSNNDGNKDLADAIKNLLKNSTDLKEDVD